MREFVLKSGLHEAVLPGHGQVHGGSVLKGDEFAKFAPQILTEVRPLPAGASPRTVITEERPVPARPAAPPAKPKAPEPKPEEDDVAALADKAAARAAAATTAASVKKS